MTKEEKIEIVLGTKFKCVRCNKIFRDSHRGICKEKNVCRLCDFTECIEKLSKWWDDNAAKW